MKRLEDLILNGKRVIVRVDFNVPLNETGEVTDNTRIKAALPTLNHILDSGGTPILLSHLGRPKNGPEEKFSLSQVQAELEKLIGKPVKFCPESAGSKAEEFSAGIMLGEIGLMENVRFHPEETKGDPDLAKAFSRLGEVYVNDAFGSAHRAHSSTAQIADFFTDKAPGFLMQAEISNAENVLNNSEKPFVAIMGGAKVSDKMEIIENLLPRVDTLLIGGGMAYTFWKAKGGEIGNSLVEEDKLDLALALFGKANEHGTKILLPVDSNAASSFSNDAESRIVDSGEIPNGFMGLDIGPQAIAEFSNAIQNAKTILWNGPMGVFEFTNFAQGTFEIGRMVVKATSSGAFSLIGGGDSAAAIKQLGLSNDVSYVSTGGGALLEYFEGKDLPGVTALE